MKIQSQAFKKGRNGGLARAVSSGLWQAPISRQAGNRHQLPLTALDHFRNYRGDRINYADDVDIKQTRNLFRVEIRRMCRGPDSRVRKQNVDWTKLRTQLLRRITHCDCVGNVSGQGQRASAGSFDLIDNFIQHLAAPRQQADRRTASRQLNSQPAANAGRRTGNQSNSV